MKRYGFWSVVIISAVLVAPVLRADVQKRERTTVKFEGLMGAFLNRAAGGSDGITSTVSVKGNRMARISGNTGQIVDLAEQKVYNLDLRRKEYRVMTFDEMRKQFEEARAQLAKQQPAPEQPPQVQDAGRELEYDVDVKETGQRKTIAGHDTHEVVLTITMRERGRALEEGGGMVMTSTMWLAPRIPALDEMNDFNLKFYKAVFDGAFSGVDGQQMNALSAIMPGVSELGERMAAESGKLDGTPLASTVMFEGVKSAEQMQAAPPSSGGGLGGMLARRLARGSTQQRTTAMTATSETLAIAATVADSDVAIPAGFTLKD